MQLLAGGARDLPVRQQTLRAAIAWSYDLLEPAEQRLFCWLAVFAGGCDLDAVEVVCQDERSPRPILDSLIALVDKNLLRVEQVNGEPRFGMLRTIQEYALELLDRNGEAAGFRLRHALTYLEFVERAAPELKGSAQAEWLRRFDHEHDNLRIASQWALGEQQAEIAFRIVGELWRYWIIRGHNQEADRWFNQLIQVKENVSPAVRAKVLNGAGAVAWTLGDLERARQHHTECLALRMHLEDAAGIAASYHNLGIVAHDQLDFQAAAAYFQKSIAGYQGLDDLWGAADSLLQLGSVLRKQKAYAESEAHLEQGLAILTELGDRQGVAGAHYLLAELAQVTARDEQARHHFTQCKQISSELGYVWGVALAEHELGLIALRENDLSQAEALLSSSLRCKHELREKMGVAYGLEAIACLAAVRKDTEKAATLLAAAETLRSAIGVPMGDELRAKYEIYLTPLQTQMARRSVVLAKEAGAQMGLDEAVQRALAPTLTASRRPASGSYPAGLTAREVEVLALVAQGLTDAEVAEKLVLSPRTVNAHLTSIYNKLGVNTRAAATRFAVEQKLV